MTPGWLRISTSSWIVVEGLRITDGNSYVVWLDGATNCTLRRLVVRRPANDGNVHAIGLAGSTWSEPDNPLTMFNLVEECIILDFHRHAMIDGANCRSNVFRRNYINWNGYQADDVYETPPKAAQMSERVFRGGLTEGGAPFTKDAAYQRGYCRTFNFLRSAR